MKMGEGDQAAAKSGFSSEGNPYQKPKTQRIWPTIYLKMGGLSRALSKMGGRVPRPPCGGAPASRWQKIVCRSPPSCLLVPYLSERSDALSESLPSEDTLPRSSEDIIRLIATQSDGQTVMIWTRSRGCKMIGRRDGWTDCCVEC